MASVLYTAINIVIAILTTAIFVIITLVVICPNPEPSSGAVRDDVHKSKNKRDARVSREALQGRLYAKRQAVVILNGTT